MSHGYASALVVALSQQALHKAPRSGCALYTNATNSPSTPSASGLYDEVARPSSHAVTTAKKLAGQTLSAASRQTMHLVLPQ